MAGEDDLNQRPLVTQVAEWSTWRLRARGTLDWASPRPEVNIGLSGNS